MANFKKLAMLCTALMMTASLAAVAACGDDNKTDSSSPDSSVSSSVDEGSSSGDEGSSSVDEGSSSEDTTSSEDEVSSSEEPTSSDETQSSDVIPDDSSSEDDSSEDDSSEVPPAGEGYYVNIVNEKAGSLTSASAFSDVWGEITFTAPSAGRYAIYAVDAEYYESSVKFGPQGATDGNAECFTRYTFDVAAAGEVKLSSYYYAWEEGETVDFLYFVYKLDSVTAENKTGSAELATCVRNEFTFSVSEAGDYVIASNSSLAWYTSLTQTEAEFTGFTYSFTASEASEYTVYVENADYNYESFNFNYEIVKIEAINATLGDKEAKLYAGSYIPVKFTAETAGTYTITVNNESVMTGVYGYNAEYDYWGWIEGDWSNAYTFDMAAGETKTLHVKLSEYGEVATADVVITLEAFEGVDPSNLQIGENAFAVTEDGVSASFTAPETGWYKIYDTVGYSIFLEGSEEGTDVYEVNLEAGATVSFTVKGDGIVTLEISKFTPPVTLNVGENTISIPSEGAELQWGNLAYGTTYSLTINNENVVVYINGTPYITGTPFEVSGWSSYSIATIDNNKAENVVITVTEFEYPTLVLGDNADIAVSANGSTYLYTVDSIDPGCYTFTVTGNVTQISLSADNAIDYPDALSQAGTISINVKAGAVIELYMEAEADTTVSVNVACTSTVKSLESSVTLNADNIPESLTIPSLKYGECAYYVANRMTGDYNITWNTEAYENIIVYAGENVGMSFDPQVRLTRTMMDGNVYLIVRNNCFDEDGNGIDLTNVVLNFAVYEEPAAEPQGQLVNLNEKTTIEIEAWDSTLFSFIAPADGTYTLKTESSVLVDLWVVGNWGYDRAWVNVIDSTTGGEYTFELTEGEIIDFFAMEYDMGAVSFVFTISEKIEDVPGDDSSSEIPNDSSSEDIPGDSSSEDSSSSSEDSSSEESEPVTVQFTEGMATYVEIPANGTTIMEGYIVGDYKVEWDPSITNLVVYCGMQPVANGDIITATSPMMPTQLTLTTSDGTALATRIMVSKFVAPPVELVVGNNAVATNNQGKTATFTAAEDGDYTLSAAEGETNAWIMIGDEYGSEAIELPYSFTLAASESISVIVLTNDFTEDTIDLVITKEIKTVTVQFTEGMATYVEIPANGTTIMEGYIVGDYTVEWDPSITNLVVYCGMQPVANGDIITATSPMMPTQLTLTTSDGAALATRIMVSKYAVPPVELVVGNNAVATNNQGKTATFTAAEDGDYTLSAAEGETNAWIMIGDEYGSEAIELPYSFTLKAGATASFIVLTNDFTEDTIDLVITIVPTADELNFTIATKENPATNDFELIANSYGVGKITLKGEYTFTWQATYKKEGEETPKEVPVVVTINGEAITSGTKINYETETEVEIVITPVDMTTGCKISFVITEVPEVVKPNEEWTKNY